MDHFKVVIEFVTIFLLSYVLGFFGCKACEMLGFPGGSVVKKSSCRHGFDLWAGKIPWRRKWQPTSVSLPGKSH